MSIFLDNYPETNLETKSKKKNIYGRFTYRFVDKNNNTHIYIYDNPNFSDRTQHVWMQNGKTFPFFYILANANENVNIFQVYI